VTLKNLPYFFLMICLLAATHLCWADDAPTKLVVGAGNSSCSGVNFSRIQDAIDAASDGQTIEVCPGLYPENLRITNSLKLKFDAGALVMPASVSQSTTSLATGNPIAAVITVMNSDNVDIET
jgi:pectin methylesterase-like acyl-CoA thioesterase